MSPVDVVVVADLKAKYDKTDLWQVVSQLENRRANQKTVVVLCMGSLERDIGVAELKFVDFMGLSIFKLNLDQTLP